MTSHIEKAWTEDVRVRRTGLEQANASGYKVNVHEIRPGVVYRDENVTVTAFPVKHGIWKEAYGYMFQTRDRKIVLSGDTAPTDEVVKACDGCDVLLHEVYQPAWRRDERSALEGIFSDVPHFSGGVGGDCAAGAAEVAGGVSPGAGEVAGGRPGEQIGREYTGAWVSAKDLGSIEVRDRESDCRSTPKSKVRSQIEEVEARPCNHGVHRGHGLLGRSADAYVSNSICGGDCDGVLAAGAAGKALGEGARDRFVRRDAFYSSETAFGGISGGEGILGVLSAVSRGVGERRGVSGAVSASGHSGRD